MIQIISILALTVLMSSTVGCSKSDTPQDTELSDADLLEESKFQSGVKNPTSTKELSFDSLKILIKPINTKMNAQVFGTPKLESLYAPESLRLHEVSSNEAPGLCSEAFDPMAYSTSSSEVGDLALARLYFCHELWKPTGGGLHISLPHLDWSCDSSDKASANSQSPTGKTEPCHLRKSSEPTSFGGMSVPRSTLLFVIMHGNLDNAQVLFLLNHLETRLKRLPTESYSNSHRFSDIADQEELFAHEDLEILKSLLPALSSYWSQKRTEDIQGYLPVTNVDVLIDLVLRKNYHALSLFAHTEASNQMSTLDSQQAHEAIPAHGGYISRLGLSALMAAAIRSDQKAIDILLQIDGINQELESTLYNANYSQIRDWKPSQFHGFYMPSSNGNNGQSGSAAPPSNPNGLTPPGDALEPGNPPSDSGLTRPLHQADKNVVLENDCENCTRLMHAVYENNCDAIESLISQDPEQINYTSQNNISALKVALERDFCLSDLLNFGANPKKHDAYLTWIKGGEMGLLQMIPSHFWQTLNQDEKNRLAQTLLSQDWIQRSLFENTFFLTAGDISESVRSLGFSSLSLSKGGLGVLISLRKNPFKLKDQSGLTLMDVLFSQRKLSLLKKIQESEKYWLAQWIKGQTFFGHNPLVTTALFSETTLLNFLVSIEGVDLFVTDAQSGLNAFQWAEYAEKHSVNILNKQNDLEDFSKTPQFWFDKVVHTVFGDSALTILKDAASLQGGSGTMTAPQSGIDRDKYLQFFNGQAKPELSVEADGFDWLTRFPFSRFSKETRIIVYGENAKSVTRPQVDQPSSNKNRTGNTRFHRRNNTGSKSNK